jgi:hypothetical protein
MNAPKFGRFAMSLFQCLYNILNDKFKTLKVVNTFKLKGVSIVAILDTNKITDTEIMTTI